MSAPHPAVLDYPFAAAPAPGTTTIVAPGIHWLRMPLPFALDHINLWLLEEPDGFTLIDCGYGDAATRALWETHFTGTMGGRPSFASSQPTIIPTISAMPRGCRSASVVR
jgi:hypothetical protein